MSEQSHTFPRELHPWIGENHSGLPIWRCIDAAEDASSTSDVHYYFFIDGLGVGYIRELNGLYFASREGDARGTFIGPLIPEEAVNLVESYQPTMEE